LVEPRIVTLTLNPTLDAETEAPSIQPVHKIHTSAERLEAGGGGINVARMVVTLGGDALALILAGGSTGRELEAQLDRLALPWQSVEIAHRTRMCLTVIDQSSGLEYRFVPQGPTVSAIEWQAALDLVGAIRGDWLVASGSLPEGVPIDAYAQVAVMAARHGLKFVLDTSGPALAAALQVDAANGEGVPAIELIKPSLRELEELVGHALPTTPEQIEAARSVVNAGTVRRVAVTLGEAGALLVDASEAIALAAPPEPVHSAVGAGDAFLAGFVLALARGDLPRHALAWGVAAGGAAVAATGARHVERAAVEARYRHLLEREPTLR
jgi:6-phosphofructokinase 2